MNIINFSSYQQDALSPLLKFKILGVDDLLSLSSSTIKLTSFYKFLSRIEKKGIIKSFYCPYTRSKFVFLTPAGNQLLTGEKGSHLCEETLFHDAYACRILVNFQRLKIITSVVTEHEFKEEFNHLSSRPDGLLYGKKENKDFCLAIEVELNQKNKTRISSIFSYYEKLSICHHVLFIFNRRQIFESYYNLFKVENISHKHKFIFVFNEKIIERNCNLLSSEIIYQNEQKTLGDLFSPCPMKA